MSRLILITNPGSASRKYALYDGDRVLVQLHFEYEGKNIICTLKDADGKKRKIAVDGLKALGECAGAVPQVLTDEEYLTAKHKLTAIVVRVPAPGDYFVEDRVVDAEYMKMLKIAEQRNPIHVPNSANEIRALRTAFKDVKIIAVSDSAFHRDKPDAMKYYSIDLDLANRFGIKRFGYHGLSYGYIARHLKEKQLLPQKLVVLHLGSGASAAAIYEGRAMDSTMGYTPLEGLTMSTRCGDIDPTAALAVKSALKLKDDEALQSYLNKECGLKGLSGCTDDMRKIIQKRDEGDGRATLAHSIFVYRVQSAIGQMTAALGGIDALVFAGTIGERSDEIRHCVSQKLNYLGLRLDEDKNLQPVIDDHIALISSADSKPIYIVETDETSQMIHCALRLLDVA